MDFDKLTTIGHSGAFAIRGMIPSICAEAASLDGVASLVRLLAERTACITMLAGSGSRWVASLEDERARRRDAGSRGAGADPSAPRGLFPVHNAMGFGPDPLPIAGYALAAVRDLGRHVLVVRGWEREIEERILVPLGFSPGSWCFATQAAPGGKPRGHGDAAFQTMDLWSDCDYVVVNFGGDASSPLTALAALAVMDALSRTPDAPALLMPAAFVQDPAYPIALDAGGLPRRFGHAKLQGAAGPEAGSGLAMGTGGYTNVGLRVYRAAALREAILGIRDRHWSPEGGYSIPGNASPAADPAGGEFALDNVDAVFAAEGRARLLALSRPQELSPVKSLPDVERFERDVAQVCDDWATLAGA